MNRSVFLLLAVTAFTIFAQTPAAKVPPSKVPVTQALAAKSAAAVVPKTVATIHELMHAMTDPGSRALWDVAVKAPENDKDWETLQNAAVLVTESANLMMAPGRIRDRGIWMKTSVLLARTGRDSLKAARAKDLDKLTEAGNDMVESCDACHVKYMKQ